LASTRQVVALYPSSVVHCIFAPLNDFHNYNHMVSVGHLFFPPQRGLRLKKEFLSISGLWTHKTRRNQKREAVWLHLTNSISMTGLLASQRLQPWREMRKGD